MAKGEMPDWKKRAKSHWGSPMEICPVYSCTRYIAPPHVGCVYIPSSDVFRALADKKPSQYQCLCLLSNKTPPGKFLLLGFLWDGAADKRQLVPERRQLVPERRHLDFTNSKQCEKWARRRHVRLMGGSETFSISSLVMFYKY